MHIPSRHAFVILSAFHPKVCTLQATLQFSCRHESTLSAFINHRVTYPEGVPHGPVMVHRKEAFPGVFSLSQYERAGSSLHFSNPSRGRKASRMYLVMGSQHPCLVEALQTKGSWRFRCNSYHSSATAVLGHVLC